MYLARGANPTPGPSRHPYGEHPLKTEDRPDFRRAKYRRKFCVLWVFSGELLGRPYNCRYWRIGYIVERKSRL